MKPRSLSAKAAICCLLLCIGCLLASPVTAQSLEIHTINVGHGDAALILQRNIDSVRVRFQDAGVAVPADLLTLTDSINKHNIPLTNTVEHAVVIDFGDNARHGRKVGNYLTRQGVTHVNKLILSHDHKDHYGGLKVLLNSFPFTYDSAFYRGRNPVRPGPNFTTSFTRPLQNKGIPLIIADLTNSDFNLFKVNGEVARLTGIVANGHFLGSTAPQLVSSDQNDYGLAWSLQFGAFRFFTGGDMSGFDLGSYTNGETPMINSLMALDTGVYVDLATNGPLGPGHFCGLKINHHGSDYSSNGWFISRLASKVAFISSGDRHRHPTLPVIEDLSNPFSISDWTGIGPPDMTTQTIQNIYITTLLANWGDARDNVGTPGNIGIIGGDIALIVKDPDATNRSVYRVVWNGIKDNSILVSSTNPANVRTPNVAGGNSYNCHSVTTPFTFKQ